MRTLGTSHLRAIMKIIQDRSLPPTLEICEFRFDVIATKRIFWLCTKIFSNTRHSFKIMNLSVHYFIFMACNNGRNKLQFYSIKDIWMVNQQLSNTNKQ